HRRAEYFRVTDAYVLGAKRGDEFSGALQRIVGPVRLNDHVAGEYAVVIVEAMVEAAQVLIGVEDLIVASSAVEGRVLGESRLVEVRRGNEAAFGKRASLLKREDVQRNGIQQVARDDVIGKRGSVARQADGPIHRRVR